MKHVFTIFKAAIFCLILASYGAGFAQETPPQKVNFQGRLTDLSDNPLNGTYTLTFSLYAEVEGGTALWTETQPDVTVTNGAVETTLGSVTAIPWSAARVPGVYLEIQVGSEVLSPRQPFNSVLYAMNAAQLAGKSYDLFVDTITTQTISGIKFFSANPVFNDNAIPQIKVSGLTTALTAVAADTTTLKGQVDGKQPLSANLTRLATNDGSQLTGVTGDGLGSHVATTTLNMANFPIINVSSLAVMTNIVASNNITAANTITAANFVGSASGLINVPGDNLGNHTAISSLNMANFPINNVSTLNVTNSVSAAKYYGDGSSLTGIAGDNLGNHTAGADLNMSGRNIVSVGTVTAAYFVGNGAGLTGVSGDGMGDHTAKTWLDMANFPVNNVSSLTVTNSITAANYYGDGSGLTNVSAAGFSGNIAASQVNAGSFQAGLYTFPNTLSLPFGLAAATGTFTGNVGVGTSTPTVRLHVSGTSIATSGITARIENLGTDMTYTGTLLEMKTPNVTGGANGELYFGQFASGSGNTPGGYVGTLGNHPFMVRTYGQTRLYVAGDGKIGMGGITAPSYQLQVNGGILATSSITANGGLCLSGDCKTAWSQVSDNLGNHTATQDLNMGVYSIITSSNITASRYYGNGSGLTGIAGDNLGNHTATMALNMGGYPVSNVASVTVSSNVTAAKYYGDGSSLTGITGDNLGNHIATTSLDMSNYSILNVGSLMAGPINATRYQIASSTVLAVLPNSSLGVGVGAGKDSTGNNNAFVGAGAGYSNTTGANNAFVGYNAGYFNVGGGNNSFVGMTAGYKNTGYNNTFMGQAAGYNNTDGGSNSFFGEYAGFSNTTGVYNSLVGMYAGNYNQTGSANTIVGGEAGGFNGGLGSGSFSSSAILGYQAGNKLTNGTGNIFVGYQAGYNVTTGSGNIIIGYAQNAPAPTTGNFLNIGGVIYGDLSTGNVGIGTANPIERLHLYSDGNTQVRIESATGQPQIRFVANTIDRGYFYFDQSYLTMTLSRGGAYGGININGSDNVGLGTPSPTHKLHVVGNAVITSSLSVSGAGLSGATPVFQIAGATMTVLADGNVGIGTLTPGAKLEVAGDIKITGGTPGAGKVLTSDSAGLASWQAASGDNLGSHIATTTLQMGNYGINSSSNITAGRYQIAGSTVLAISAGDGSSLGVGVNAGRVNTGAANSFVGYQAGYSNTTGLENSFFGYGAGFSNTTGNWNTFLGDAAGYNHITGNNNAFVGSQAGFSNTAGNYNAFLGYRAGYLTQGSANAIFGSEAGYGVVSNSFSSSTIMGYRAGYGLTTGSDNILLGYQAGDSITTGKGNLIIGYDQDASAPSVNNELNIGGVIYGDLSAKNIGISTRAPQAPLDVMTTNASPSSAMQIWRRYDGVGVATMTAIGALTAAAFIGDGSGLTNISGTDNTKVAKAGDTMTGQLTLANSTLTVTGSAFSVGGSTFVVKDGRVGIGLANPFYPLDVYGRINAMDQIDIWTLSGPARLQAPSGTLTINAAAGGDIELYGNDIPRAIFKNTGNVGISTGAPQARLDVLAAGSAQTDMAQIWRNSAGTIVSSMSATGVMNATKFVGNEAVLSGPVTIYDSPLNIRYATMNAAVGIHAMTSSKYSYLELGNLPYIWAISNNSYGDNSLNFAWYNGSTAWTKKVTFATDGNVGISTGTPQARLDVVAAGSAQADMAQLWRNSAGTIVSSVSATGVMQAAKFIGDGTGLTGISGDNLGNHTAAQNLNMAGFQINNISTVTIQGQNIVVSPYSPGGNYEYAISIGSGAYNNYTYGVGVGHSASDNRTGGVGVGYQASSNYTYGVGVGYVANYNYNSGVGVGYNAWNNYNNGVGMGANAFGNANYAVGIGAYSQNNQTYGSALGAYSYAASSSVALGSYAKANAKESIAIGAGTVNNSTGTASFGVYAINTSSNLFVAGNVGIGTASPASVLDLSFAGSNGIRVNSTDGSAPSVKLYQSGAEKTTFHANSGDSYLGTADAANMHLITNNASKLTVLSGGNVGVGTATPGGKLSVQGTGTSSVLFVSTASNGGSANFVVNNAGYVGVGTASPAVLLDVNGEFRPGVYTVAQLGAKAPGAAGTLVICSDCTANYSVCVSTSTVIGAYSLTSARANCQ